MHPRTLCHTLGIGCVVGQPQRPREERDRQGRRDFVAGFATQPCRLQTRDDDAGAIIASGTVKPIRAESAFDASLGETLSDCIGDLVTIRKQVNVLER